MTDKTRCATCPRLFTTKPGQRIPEDQPRTLPSKAKDETDNPFELVCIWLESALKCKAFVWSPDQADAAAESLRMAREKLKAHGNETREQRGHHGHVAGCMCSRCRSARLVEYANTQKASEPLPHMDTCGLKYGGKHCTCGLQLPTQKAATLTSKERALLKALHDIALYQGHWVSDKNPTVRGLKKIAVDAIDGFHEPREHCDRRRHDFVKLPGGTIATCTYCNRPEPLAQKALECGCPSHHEHGPEGAKGCAVCLTTAKLSD